MGLAVDEAALDLVLLIRIGRSGCTEAALLRDVQPYIAHALSPADWRRTAELRFAALQARRLIQRSGRSKWVLTTAGLKAAKLRRERDGDFWPHLRDTTLIASALGLKASPRFVASLAKIEGLRHAIVQQALGLPLTVMQPEKLRRRISAEAGNLVEPRLASLATAPGRDADVIARLASEVLGLGKADAAAIRCRILRNFIAPPVSSLSAAAATPARVTPPPRIDPDLPRFAATVRELAAVNATGWIGNRRAYISHVWRAVRATQPHWDISENNFKSLLTAAHRSGHLELVNADLKDRTALRDIEASATAYNNTVWHLIRVGEQ